MAKRFHKSRLQSELQDVIKRNRQLKPSRSIANKLDDPGRCPSSLQQPEGKWKPTMIELDHAPKNIAAAKQFTHLISPFPPPPILLDA
jgi:hypothetical protein